VIRDLITMLLRHFAKVYIIIENLEDLKVANNALVAKLFGYNN